MFPGYLNGAKGGMKEIFPPDSRNGKIQQRVCRGFSPRSLEGYPEVPSVCGRMFATAKLLNMRIVAKYRKIFNVISQLYGNVFRFQA